ncbi:uncharacterized protein SCHCODRAFT_02617261 [Schizophyllum commune H4-8]|uniref:Expressed protein n=1 Tax=Schizophyllum commune (strain H4-8 / FGSC 9210) TaxID=578458 RepID=D8Q2Q4_SCHCM|nr:uncharacterized protein SCHCODRAFT_02617261 [Schizophyllum commune H4-8]KAI5894557.1 hypothetical protein SCHCODRAFT_02617261 [Schizophyllum commune H4-8]
MSVLRIHDQCTQRTPNENAHCDGEDLPPHRAQPPSSPSPSCSPSQCEGARALLALLPRRLRASPSLPRCSAFSRKPESHLSPATSTCCSQASDASPDDYKRCRCTLTPESVETEPVLIPSIPTSSSPLTSSHLVLASVAAPHRIAHAL